MAAVLQTENRGGGGETKNGKVYGNETYCSNRLEYNRHTSVPEPPAGTWTEVFAFRGPTTFLVNTENKQKKKS